MKRTEKEELVELGKRLKFFRKKSGYNSYEKFAYDIGISRSQYGKYEKGGNIKFSTLFKILSFLEVSFHDFFNQNINEIKNPLNKKNDDQMPELQ